MKLDDLKTWLGTNLPAFTTALSLTTLAADQIVLREFQEPGAKAVQLWLDEQPEEIEPLTMGKRLVSWRIHAYVFVCRGATEANERAMADNYATALLNCLATHADYFGVEAREHYDGVEGKGDIKATKLSLLFMYEE